MRDKEAEVTSILRTARCVLCRRAWVADWYARALSAVSRWVWSRTPDLSRRETMTEGFQGPVGNLAS